MCISDVAQRTGKATDESCAGMKERKKCGRGLAEQEGEDAELGGGVERRRRRRRRATARSDTSLLFMRVVTGQT